MGLFRLIGEQVPLQLLEDFVFQLSAPVDYGSVVGIAL